MALRCNIDPRGRTLRMRLAAAFLLLGSVSLLGWAWPQQSTWGWAFTALLLALALVAFLQARLGWCIARAAGFRTPF
jgi:hypothetical protein